MAHYPPVDPCTVGYLRLITTQLKVLSQITKNDRLHQWYLKVKHYNRYPNILKMYEAKYHALKKLNRL
jgi:hypothetical protein